MESGEVTIGGIQTYILALAELIFQEYGIKVKIAQFYHKNAVLNFDNFEIYGYKERNKSNKSLYRRIKNDFSGNDTLIIWGSDQYAVDQSKFKAINIQHGIGFDTVDSSHRIKRLLLTSGMSSVYKLLQRWKARRISLVGDVTVCVDYNFKNWISTYCLKQRERFNVIPNFSDNLDSERAFSNKANRILIARRFVKRRGIKLAVEAADKIISKHPDVHVCFAGNGPEQFLIQELCQKYPRNVTLTQFEAGESLHFHAESKFALLPSIGSEGTSFSLLEAMGAGCCVVSTDVGGLTNIILDNFNGKIVSPNVNSIVCAFDELLSDDDKARRLSNTGFVTVKHAFSKEQWRNKWGKLLSEYLEK
ncbi:glycosyltransferase family 4 protein [Halomonas cupida]|uniref:glycosyltransferase family 4 protein n=1 Tax=Halomonas cupida TaxID=44933 RepID=UPI003EF8258C